jgi:large subunit ribosomal protein L4|uniref:Large ribosomal subunit protein uL4 n=1 Tax=candidate division WOR-3 bacterium TaxID=2052148 RepID=A0A7C3UUF4_UNCW3
MKVNLLTITGEVKKEIEIPDEVFNAEIKEGVVWEVVRNYLANQRQGTAKTKTRGEVSGGGRKPWPQKHTGRARHGSIRSPIWVGGGKVFGPKPRDYSYSLPKKKRRKALFSSLSARMKENGIIFIEDFSLPQPKTKEMANILKNLSITSDESCLLLLPEMKEEIKLSARNIPHLKCKLAKDINTYDVLENRKLVFTEKGLETFLLTIGVKESEVGSCSPPEKSS